MIFVVIFTLGIAKFNSTQVIFTPLFRATFNAPAEDAELVTWRYSLLLSIAPNQIEIIPVIFLSINLLSI